MTIVDIWHKGKFTYMYCLGEEIHDNFSCERITTREKTYDVDAFEVLTSLTGKHAAVVRVRTNDRIDCGEAIAQ